MASDTHQSFSGTTFSNRAYMHASVFGACAPTHCNKTQVPFDCIYYAANDSFIDNDALFYKNKVG